MNTKQTAYSVLDLVLISEGRSLKETFNNSLELAQVADQNEYKRYWLAEHHNSIAIGSSATVVLIGYVAQETQSIRVGSGGIMLPNHSPLIVAEQFGTLGALYPNRIDLGLGRAPGTDPQTAQAIRSDFMQAAHSFPSEIQKIETYFSSENSNAKVRATVAEGVNVPLYILGSSTDSAHLAAQKGLPYAFASHFATTHLFDALEIYRNEFTASKTLKTPYTIAGVNIIIAPTDEAAQKISTSFVKMIVGILTGKRGYVQAPVEMTPDLEEVMQHPAVQKMLKYSFIGSKDTVKTQIKEFLEKTNVHELIAATNIYDHSDRVYSYTKFAEIMKELNEAE
ncbi:LLM class flavin-dependent oxidoreductase [Cochleicola gelatinilyticus]|uniref:Luciferase-like monooxygenase n=1 Tax=Cochleicola gelatinilyticus TaxID=1763537 RepID=A0A167HD99_9FLAO|nr:LLM class flavin-dependent oxidoreductase [Cochleicola gelatinilyticus]OAB78496.1 hypothetical protein ULVI_07840 [Cochleicola gelatinilyticus]